jgi:hypothetical protein
MSNRRRYTIIDAIDDRNLFAGWFRDRATWSSWFTFLRAFYSITSSPGGKKREWHGVGGAIGPSTRLAGASIFRQAVWTFRLLHHCLQIYNRIMPPRITPATIRFCGRRYTTVHAPAALAPRERRQQLLTADGGRMDYIGYG